MDTRILSVPSALLRLAGPSAPAKLVWMGMKAEKDHIPAQLQARTGLCRHTVLKALPEAQALRPPQGGPRVQMPLALLAERCVRAHAKLLYCFLQLLPSFRGQHGWFTYAELAALSDLSPFTVRQCLQELEGAGWIRLRRKNRLRAVHVRLGTPQQRRSEAEAAVAMRRIQRAEHHGEAIMQEFLSLVVASADFADNERPGWLVSPLTQERLELDRFYRSARVALEFHGEQHDRATGRFTQQQVDDQRLRDLIKAGLCLYEGVHLIIVRAEDLTLDRMRDKVRGHLPLRDLTGQEQLIALLEAEGAQYLAAAVRRGRPLAATR